MKRAFDNDDWDSLLDHIANRHVLPVIGPALVTVLHEGAQRPLFEVLAQPLAAKLGLASGTWANTMHVAREAVSRGLPSGKVWDALKSLLRSRNEPGPGLLALAEINCFDLYIASTPDELMACALKSVRSGFDQHKQVFYFCDRGRATPHPAAPTRKDVSAQFQQYGDCQKFCVSRFWIEGFWGLRTPVSGVGVATLTGAVRVVHRVHGVMFDDAGTGFLRPAMGEGQLVAR